MNRRQFLGTFGAGLVTAAFPLSPALARAENPSFPLAATPGRARITSDPGLVTRVWQYNQQTPGPIIRVKQGETVSIPFTNRLDQPTTVHWHGLRIDNRMDGVPGMTQSAIEPGEAFHYRFTPQDAGTFWYHTHNRTWEQLARGLHGTLIVEERDPIQVDQDLVFVVDDWLIDENGQIDEASMGSLHDWAHAGRLGNILTVNGQYKPGFPVKTGERIRLRCINVANSRVMPLQVQGVTAHAIAIDGQPVTPYPLENGEFTLAPAQRIDLILDMTQSPGQQAEVRFFSRRNELVAATFDYHPTEVARSTALTSSIELPPNPLPNIDLAKAQSFKLPMEGGAMGGMRGAEYQGKWTEIRELAQQGKIWALNGVADLPEKPFFSVKRGTVVTLDIENLSSWPHAMHTHGHHFKPVDDQGRLEPVWRDTILLDARENRKIAMVADNPGKWLFHCHMVEHTAGGMITWFEVT